MSDYIFQRLSERPANKVIVNLFVESGCNPKDGEYSLFLVSSSLPMDICSIGGVDDISKVKECIENEIDSISLPEEGLAEIHLIESGEWEDVFWNKYYLIDKVDITDFNSEEN